MSAKLTAPQIAALRECASSGLGMPEGRLTITMKALLAKGLVEKRCYPSPLGQFFWRLTEAGRAAMAETQL